MGAVTWGNGTTGIIGVALSTSNSLVVDLPPTTTSAVMV
ncbi:MAG: hypothetical protein U0929_18250 [Planctomycetaceae bacterium]